MDPSLETAAADNLLAQLPRLIVKEHNMIGIPAHRTRDVQRDLRENARRAGILSLTTSVG